jgi:catechol 2,3-dioxygenase-like lactoylglutathione lyase family enzyme
MLNVSDIEASLEFYPEALDFKLVSNPDAVQKWHWATIRSGWTESLIRHTWSPGQYESLGFKATHEGFKLKF